MRLFPRALIVVLVSWLMASTGSAQAPADQQYERAVADGLAAFRGGQFAKARELFERAHLLRPNARTLRALGLSAVELKRYTQARAELEAARSDTRQPLTAAQRDELNQMLTWMQHALATVQLRVEPAHAQVLVDGEPTSAAQLVLEPGSHTFRVTADGYEAVDHAMELAAAENRSLELVLTRSPVVVPPIAPAPVAQSSPAFVRPDVAPPPSPARTPTVFGRWWFWTAVGAVVVGGTVTAVALASSGDDSFVEPVGTKVLVLRAGR